MMNEVLTPETILFAVLAALAARVLIHSRRPADTVEGEAGGGAEELPACEADRCSWRVHVVGVAHRRCTIIVSGRPVHLKPGDLLLAMRPKPSRTEHPAATHGQSRESTSADLAHAS
ncbi:MAG: hypothetical protein ACREOF_11785 [Gemmatimonadales bacterium]